MSSSGQRDAREYEYDAAGIHMTIMCGATRLYYAETGGPPEDLMHTHSWFEIFCPLEGPVTLYFGTEVQRVSPGEAVIVPPGAYHYAVFSEPKDKTYGFNFFIEYLQQSETAQILRKLLDPQKCCYVTVNEACQNMTRYLAQALEQKNGALSGTYLLALLLNCAQCRNPAEESYQGSSADNKESRIYRIEQALYANYTGKMPIKLLAEELHLSQRQVSRIIQRHYGTSFRSKNKDLRMQSAEGD